MEQIVGYLGRLRACHTLPRVLRILRVFGFAHCRSSPIHTWKSRCARSANRLFFASFFTLPGSGSSHPTLAFIGWKCRGSRFRWYRYRPPRLLVAGGGTSEPTHQPRRWLLPALVPAPRGSV